MTLYETIDLLKKIALKHPNIGSASEGNIYEYMNANPSVKYGVFFITQGTHSQDEMFNHFEFTLFYVDRLVDDMEENRLQIQSIGKEILSNILTFFCEEFDAECENISFQPFTQRFVDETAGIYSTITIDVPKDVICPEEYWKEDWKTPVIVIHNQDKRVVFTENGTYTIDYDPNTYTGLGTVEVNVNIDVDSYYNNGYNQGKTDGISEQKTKLESINITENGTYSREDGYSHIEVNVPDLNGSYNEGYEQGKADGVNEQKSKLESISITENGTYSKEDGYNHIEVNVPDLNGSYDEGYEQGHTEGYAEGERIGYDQGQADVAANARVLNVTENGNYLSKFSDPILPTTVTGVYADGTEFYNYAYLEGISYDSGFIVSEDMKVEIWWKGDVSKTDKNLFGSQVNNNYAIFKIRIPDTAYRFDGEIAMRRVTYLNAESNRWYHFKMSYADGLWVDGVKIGDFSANISGTPYKLYINSNTPYSFNGVNGYYGMIKITTNGVENIIIPTAEGLKNITTNEILQVAQNGSYTFTENMPIYPEGELYKTINVNVLPKVNPQKYGLRLGYSTFTEVPEWLDFNGITNMSNMFRNCGSIQTIPLLDTSKVANMGYMFYNCTNLQTIPLLSTSNVTDMSYMFGYCKLKTIPLLDTSNVTDMSYMFFYCSNLQTIPQIDTSNVTNIKQMFMGCTNLQTIPLLNTSNVTNMVGMFYSCSNLQAIPPLDTSKVTDMGEMFNGCSQLTSLPAFNAQSLDMPPYSGIFGYSELPKLTDFGGLLNLKSSLTSDSNFKRVPNLTYQSCINVLNGLYDFVGNGETPNSRQGQLKVHQNFLTTVGDEISIGTNKGWTITA